MNIDLYKGCSGKLRGDLMELQSIFGLRMTFPTFIPVHRASNVGKCVIHDHTTERTGSRKELEIDSGDHSTQIGRECGNQMKQR